MLIDLHINESGHVEVTRHGEYPVSPWRLSADFPAERYALNTETVDDPNVYEHAGGLWIDSSEYGPVPATRWYVLHR